ncbi:MAG: DUF6993 domain-containing protein [Mycetocola sp.]
MTLASLRTRRWIVTVAGAAVVTVAMAGCSLFGMGGSTPTPTPTPATDEAPAELLPEGSAEDNKPYFDRVNGETAAAETADGRHFIDGLIDAGFERDDMSVTSDTTSIGLDADAIEFAVRWGDQCLIGQFGESMGYSSTVTQTLAGDRCLIGSTRPIDWE